MMIRSESYSVKWILGFTFRRVVMKKLYWQHWVFILSIVSVIFVFVMVFVVAMKGD